MQHRPIPRTVLLFSLVATCLAFLIYFPGLSGDYVFDDFPNLLENQALHIDNLDTDSVLGASLSANSGALKRPVSMLSFALNYYFFGKDPYSLKVTNLVIHILNGIGLFILTYCLLGISRSTNKLNLSTRMIPWLSAVVALIWLAHPINLTSVLYIVQRMSSLSSFFMIYGLIFYIWYRNRVFENNGNLYVLLAGCTLFFLLAIFSKENGVLFALYLLLAESFLFRFRNADQQRNVGITVSFSILVVIPLLALLVWMSVNIDVLTGGFINRNFTLTERLLTEFRVLSTYLQLLVTPSITELGLFHDDIEVSRSFLDPSTTLLSAALLASLLIVATYTFRRLPLLSFGLFWFFTSHLLESSVLPLELMHEHRNYLASYGIILSMVAVASVIFNKFRYKSLSVPVIILTILVFAALTFFRASQWGSTISLALSEAEHHPDSPRATYAAARLYVKLVLNGGEKKLTSDAMQRLDTAIAVGKQDIKPDIARLILASKSGLQIEDEWLNLLHSKLTEYTINVDEVNALTKFNECQRNGCDIRDQVLVNLYLIALNNKGLGSNDKVHAHLVNSYADFSLNNLQDYELTERLFQKAITISPAGAQYRINYIGLLIQTGRKEEAEDQLETLIKIDKLGNLSFIINDLRKRLSALEYGPQVAEENKASTLGMEPTLGYDSP